VADETIAADNGAPGIYCEMEAVASEPLSVRVTWGINANEEVYYVNYHRLGIRFWALYKGVSLTRCFSLLKGEISAEGRRVFQVVRLNGSRISLSAMAIDVVVARDRNRKEMPPESARKEGRAGDRQSRH
jgi:hypothetical protein